MLVAPKYEGLDLPVHDPDTFVATAMDMASRQRFEDVVKGYTAPTFVRAMMIQLRNLSYAPNSAADLLEKTDSELEKVAELCGVLVVKHEWGLYPVHDKGHDYRGYLPSARGLGGLIELPKDHILVAEVEVVKPTSTSRPDVREAVDTIHTGVDKYYEEGKGTYQLFDMSSLGQYVFGTTVNSSAGQARLVDIEPRFELTR